MESRIRDALETAAAVVGVWLLFARRAWWLVRFFYGAWRAWGSSRRFQELVEENAMSGKMGIVSLLGAISVLAMLGNIGGKAYEDGKLNEQDVLLLGDAVAVLPVAIKVNWMEVVPEAKDLQADEAAQALAHFKTVFDIPQDNTEVVIEDVLAFVAEGASLLKRAIDIFKHKNLMVAGEVANEGLERPPA